VTETQSEQVQGQGAFEKEDTSQTTPRNWLAYLHAYLPLVLVGGAVVALDQWSKYLVRTNLTLGETWMPLAWLAPYARVVHWRNSGAAFGMFQGGGMIFTGLAAIVAVLILYYFPRVPRNERYLRVAMGLQFGGALGNLIDRLMHDFLVVDMISVGEFPVFNVADASVSVGVAVLVLGIWLSDRQVKEAAEAAEHGKEEGDDAKGVRAR
jgi:signal peptidase II